MAKGILIIDKPQGWTSQDVCAKLRGVFHEKRIGHGGTLDPMATGVLPVFVGRATRAVEFVSEGDKEYLAGLRLGVVTNTQDTTGETLETRPVSVTHSQLEAVLADFCGAISQIPPMYSAIKIQGKKLYELARKGKEVERPPRPITIYALTMEEQLSSTDFLLRVRCSKGTYVRTLCHDIGEKLGCGGAMFSLRRTMAGNFSLENTRCYPLDEVVRHPNPASLLLPVESCFSHLPHLPLHGEDERAVRNGRAVSLRGLPDGAYRVYGEQGEFLALGRMEQGLLHTVKSFFDVSVPDKKEREPL